MAEGLHKEYKSQLGVVAHAFNPSTWEAEAGGFLNSRPAWSTEWVPGQPGLHRETLSRKTKPNQTKNTKTKQNKKNGSMPSSSLSALEYHPAPAGVIEWEEGDGDKGQV